MGSYVKMTGDFVKVQAAIEAIARGEMVIMVDDEDRENEGDLVIAAEHCGPAQVNFMCKEARGLVCMPMTPERVETLGLPMMVPTAPGSMGTAFTVSIEAKTGVSTGISAADRARTIEVACDPSMGASDIVSPGHVFPLRAQPGGVLVRSGHTEGSIDLARLAGCRPAAVICEIMNDDGTMARMDALEVFAKRHNLHIVSISDLIAYRLRQESLVRLESERPFVSPLFGITEQSDWTVRSYKSDGRLESRFLLFTKGDLSRFSQEIVPIRAQRRQILGDVFGAFASDQAEGSGSRLRAAFSQIDVAGLGAILYVLGDDADLSEIEVGKGGGLRPKESGFRDFGLGAQVLKSVGIKKIRVLTNNPRKIVGLEGYGIEVTGSETLKLSC